MCSALARAACRAFASRASRAHGALLQTARDDAALVLARDPELKSERGEALRILLYLFERDEAVRLIQAG
jgi:ATP-dependent DNA helicase RecG